MAAVTTVVSDFSDTDVTDVATENVYVGTDVWEIDLGEDGRKALALANAKVAKLLAPFTEKGRKLEAKAARKASDGNAARVWLKAKGFEVAERGAIKAEHMAAYRLAQSEGKA